MVGGYKGFNQDMTCNPTHLVKFQYGVGKEYEEPVAVVCHRGFHFCEYPLDVFEYYPPESSRYCVVQGRGTVVRDDIDSKVCCTKIRIDAEIKLSALIQAGIKFISEHLKWHEAEEPNTDVQSNTGDRSIAMNTSCYSASVAAGNRSIATNTGYHSIATSTGDKSIATSAGYGSAAINTGYQSAATNTGDLSVATNTSVKSIASNAGSRSAATTTGYYSAVMNSGYQSIATSTGDKSIAINTGNRSAATNMGYYSVACVEGAESVAMALGYDSKARGALGCWIVLAEWEEHRLCRKYDIKDVQCVRVDGEKIKANTWYQLVNGKFKEVEERE